MKITKIIHQTWRDQNIPHDIYFEEWHRSWSEVHPDWKYIFWTDADNERLVRHHYPEFLEAYLKIEQGVTKSDIARALYLHKFGGMYADMDFICLRRFDPLLEVIGCNIVVGMQDQAYGPMPNAWMYSPPGEEFWLTLVRDGLADFTNGVFHRPEQICGPDRLKWALEIHGPSRTELAFPIVYPFAWGNEKESRKAESLDWHNVPSLREAYPDSLAVTCWRHNW